jgi:hypothetical protein
MESTQSRRSTTTAAPATPEAERRLDATAFKEETDRQIAERVSSPPEQPTPTQAEADAIKSGEAVPPGEARSGAPVERDVRPGASGAGYTTR